MKKVIIAILLIMALSLTGCSSSKQEEEPIEDVDLSLAEDLVLSNEFFGFELTIPKGWYMISINDSILSSAGEGTSSEPVSDAVSEEGIMYLDIVNFMSTLDVDEDDNFEVNIFAEKMDASIEDYKEKVKATMALDTNGLPFFFISEEAYTMNEVTYALSHFETEPEENQICIDYYLYETKGYYFNIAFIYWKKSINAYKDVAADILGKIVWSD